MPTLDDSGFVPDTLSEVREEIAADLRAEFGSDLLLTDTSQLGKLCTVFARREVALQDMLGDVLDALSLDQASGTQLVRLAQLNGTNRLAATRSTIAMRAVGASGTLIGDKRVRSNTTNAVFRIPLGTTITAAGLVTFVAVAEQTGDVQAFAGDTWTIVDTVFGWTGVGATADYTPGSAQETQEALRARARQAARSNARATEPAVREAAAAVPGVTSVGGNFVRGPLPVDGTPGFHVELILDGTFNDTDVATMLYQTLGETTPSFGSTEVPIVIETGATVSFFFTRVELLRTIFRITIDRTGAEVALPLDYEETVRAAVVDYVNSLARGVNVSPAVAAGRAVNGLPSGSFTDFGGEAAFFGDPYQSTPLTVDPRERAYTIGGATSGQVTGTLTEPFNLTAGWTLNLSIDGAAPVQYTVVPGDFAVISAATATEFAEALAPVLGAAATASNVNGRLSITSASTGVTSTVNVLVASSAALLAVLGLSVGISAGTDTDVEVLVIP